MSASLRALRDRPCSPIPASSHFDSCHQPHIIIVLQLPSSHHDAPSQEGTRGEEAILSTRKGTSPTKRTRRVSEACHLTPQPARKEWTEEEEVVWREILEKTIRKHLLQAVREDGRLDARKNSIKSHMNALVSSANDLIELTPDREHEA